MATWDEIKRNRQAQARTSASANSWEEIKRQRGYKPVESTPVASPTPATRQYAPVDMRSPSLIRAAEEAVARAMETGDTSQMAALVGKPDLLSPVKPSDVSPDVFTAYKPGLNVGESFVYGSGKTAEGLAGVGNAVVFAPAEFLYGGLGALTGLFGDNAVSDWFYEQSRKSAEMDIFGEKKLSEALESKYGEKLSDADRTVGGIVKSGSEMLGSAAIGNVAGAALGAPSMLAGSTKAITPSLVSRSVFTANAYRGAVEEALSDGASIEEASAYGALAATVSTAVESIADGIPGLDNPNSITSKIFNKLKQTPQALKVFASIAGEGGEEVIEEIITPYVKRMTYDPKAETATLNDLAIAFASGSVLSGLMQGGAGIAGGLAYGKTGTPQTQIDAPSLDFGPKQKTIIEKILRGEEISGNQAEIIAKSPDAITFLRLVTGQEINTDAPISSLKRDIRALATGRATVDTQKGAQTAVATPTTAYGKAGQKAVKELQLPNQPRAQYQSDFSKFYQAGVTGTKFENIPYTGILTEPQRRGAYIAGQADAETSLAEEKYNAQFATVYKDDAGLIRNDYTPKLSKEETSFINTLFKAAGVKGEFAAPTGDKGANGWIENGIVKIAQDAADPFMVVAKHEITHRMQVIAPEAYRQYRDYAINAIGEDAVENKRAFYESRGINLTYEQAMDEVAADFTEALLTDKSKIERLVSDNRTLAQRFFDALKEFVANVKAAFKGKAAQDATLAKYGVTIEQLEKATKLWEDTLKATAETVRASEDATTAETDIQFSLKEYDTLLESGETGTAFNPYSGYYTIVMNGTAFGDFDTENEATHFLETNRKHLEIVDPNADGLPLFDTNEFYKQAGNQFELNQAYQQYESSKTKKTSINTILMNLSNYRDADLYSLAEQVSNGNWDGYEELSRPELEAAIRDVLNERAGDLNALEQQSPKYGFFVRPIVDNKIPTTDPDARYSLKDSEGNALTPEQVEFFKDSKVRDENGNLLVVYHGTSEQFTVFDRTKGRSGMDIQGSFFSPWELDAKGYGDRVGAYYINIVNPADEGTAYKALNRFKGQNYAGIKAREYLESLGYDGVNNNNEEYIAFSPEQIKSVDNKNPTSDPDIRYSLKGSKEYEQEIKEQKERARKAEKRVKEIIRREAEKREAAVAKIKEHYQAKDAKTRDLQQRRELRNKIKRQINTLSQMLLRPSDTKHIPEALRKPIAEFLASIDLSTDRMGDNTLRRLDKLKAAYQKILEGASDVQAEIDPDIIAKIEELSDALETKKLSELSRDELQNLWEITKGMRKTVTDYNKLFAQNIRETVSEMGTAAINEQGTKAYTESALRIKQSLANLVNMDMLDSFSFFEQLGPTMQRLFQNIRDGLDVKITHTKEAADYMIDLLRDTKIDEWTGSKAKAKTFVTSVGKISLTPSQVMSLYLLNRQPEAQNHIYAGGIKAAPVVTRAGKNRLPKITKSFETLKVTPDDVNNIINSLSAEQKRIAEGISKFFTDYTAKWGNEVSMTLYGYEKFKVEKYFPIVSDRNYISQVYGEVTDKTLKNMGITKSRIEGANNPIIIEDAFDVFTRQADAMASYHAFVVPLTDIQRVWNFKTLDGSVKQAIEKRYGQRALSYFSRLITDINGGARVEAGSEFVNTLIGRYKASRVGMNLRVVVQQPTSIIRASVMIDPKYLAKGATKKGNWNTVLKYAPIAQWKDWGYFNLYTGKQLKDIFLNKHRASDTFMLAAGKADQLAWQVMWNACEYEVQDTHPSLTKGSEEYYQAVAKRFSDIIDRTQVVDSVLHRTQIMRSKDALVKMSVAFMTEPMKSYNLFRLAAQDYMQNKTSEAKKRLARTVVGLAATAVINSAIASLVDALRDDEDELSYWEKWLSSFADDVKWVVPEMFPYVKDLTSMLRGYDIKRMDMAGIGDLLNAIKMLASDKYTPQAKVANVIAKSADLFGIPASAIKREISTIINNAKGVFDNVVLEYETEKMMYDIDSSNNKGRYYDLVYRAWQKDDKTEFTKIVADLLNHGYTKETIENAVQSRAKKTKEYTKEQANVYALVAESMKSHEFYGTLSDRYKDKAEDYAKQYANAVALRSVLEPNPDAEKIDAEIEKLRRDLGEDFYSPETQAEVIGMELEKGYTPQKWVLGADGTDKFEFDPAKYILYRVALQMVDEGNDNNSSYNSKERKAAMNLVGLSKEDQRYLEWLNKQ